jgi:membrane-bound lytic murein transglycosylase D
VKSGDSLWSISRRFGVTTGKLAHWNGIAPRDTLRPGQKLSIWSTQTTASNTSRAPRDQMVRKVGYKVRSGDSLALIASKFNVRVKDIIQWNSVNTKKYIHPGQRLTLYVDITAMN